MHTDLTETIFLSICNIQGAHKLSSVVPFITTFDLRTLRKILPYVRKLQLKHIFKKKRLHMYKFVIRNVTNQSTLNLLNVKFSNMQTKSECRVTVFVHV